MPVPRRPWALLALPLTALALAGCGGSAAAGPAQAADEPVVGETVEMTDTELQQAVQDCLAAAGWTVEATPGTEQFGSATAELGNSAPGAWDAINACRTQVVGPVGEPPDVPEAVLAAAAGANQEAFEACMEGRGFHPVEDDEVTITGYGFAHTYPDGETLRADYQPAVGDCGTAGNAAQDAVIAEYDGD